MAQQSERSAPDGCHSGLVAGQQERAGDVAQLRPAHAIVTVTCLDHGVQQVRAWLTTVTLDERGQVGEKLVAPSSALGHAVRADAHGHSRPVTELVEIAVGDSEYFSDHHKRERFRECRHQIGGWRGCQHAVGEVLRDLPDARPPSFGTARGERAAENATYPCVPWRIQVDQSIAVVGHVRTGLQPGRPRLAQVPAESWIGEHGLDVVKAHRKPHDVTTWQFNLPQRIVLTAPHAARRTLTERLFREGKGFRWHDTQLSNVRRGTSQSSLCTGRRISGARTSVTSISVRY